MELEFKTGLKKKKDLFNWGTFSQLESQQFGRKLTEWLRLLPEWLLEV